MNNRPNDVIATPFTRAHGDGSFVVNRVKAVHPNNVAIIAGLAVTCWLPVALSAYWLAG